MVGIIIFTLGFLGAYLLIQSASNASLRSRDEIIGANIMREQIELLKNMRDTNWIQFRKWDSIELAKPSMESDTTLRSGNFYSIASNYTGGKSIHIEKIVLPSLSTQDMTKEFQKDHSAIRLCTDSLGRYVHDCTGTNTKTSYASFFKVEPLMTTNTLTNTPITVDRAYKITVFFVSFSTGYRITNMSTIITDWKNQ